jgi:archaeosine synthase beta-subunit
MLVHVPGPFSSSAERTQFVLAHRPARGAHNPWRHQGTFVEDERAADGTVARVVTVFLTGRECPWHCVMCDLWKYTTEEDTPAGALVRQLDEALASSASDRENARAVKLYNAGSFFDPRAVPPADHAALARRLVRFERVIVESHPALVGPRVRAWHDTLAQAAAPRRAPALEVALGLETAHPEALAQLHKEISLDDFRRAADTLRAMDVDVRVFLLVGVPFVAPEEQRAWVQQSVSFAFDCGASVVSLIPTRAGNGAVDVLAGTGAFIPPTLADLEWALDACVAPSRGRVFADLWNIEALASCASCAARRRVRLHRTNLEQRVQAAIACERCGGTEAAA